MTTIAETTKEQESFEIKSNLLPKGKITFVEHKSDIDIHMTPVAPPPPPPTVTPTVTPTVATNPENPFNPFQ